MQLLPQTLRRCIKPGLLSRLFWESFHRIYIKTQTVSILLICDTTNEIWHPGLIYKSWVLLSTTKPLADSSSWWLQELLTPQWKQEVNQDLAGVGWNFIEIEFSWKLKGDYYVIKFREDENQLPVWLEISNRSLKDR